MKKIILLMLLVTSMTAIAQPYLTIGSNSTSIDVSTGDLNTLSALGFYRGYGMTNAPDAGWWYITVETHNNTSGASPGWTKQTITSFGAGNTYQAGTTFIRNQTGGTDWTPWSMVLQSGYNGNVGIGTTTPGSKLDVAGMITGTGSSTPGNGTLSNMSSLFNGLRFNGDISAASQNGITYQSGGGGSAAISFYRGGGYNTGIDFYTNPTSNQGFGNMVHRMRLTESGALGIGTTDPGSCKLAVEGTIGAHKVRVTLNGWADYVFDSSYQLAPLSQVEQYIRQNKHLPDVPSTSEVKKEGLDLGDNQAILLKKIEELTLYILQQDKELKSIREEMRDLRIRLK